MKTFPAFDGKVCVVTGAASGIGRAVALALAASGARLALTDINKEELAKTVDMIGGSNQHKVDVMDMADAEAITAYAPEVEAALGPADYVFNIAGLSRFGDFRNTPAESFEMVMDVNFYGMVRMSKAFLEQLIRTQGGLVNVSSIYGIIGVPGQAHYCASKFGIRGFSEALSQEMEDHGVTVTSVHPGGVKTNVVRNGEVDSLTHIGTTKDKLVENFDKNAARTSAEEAARVILDGTTRKKMLVLIGADARLVQRITRLFPVRYRNFVRKRMDRITAG